MPDVQVMPFQPAYHEVGSWGFVGQCWSDRCHHAGAEYTIRQKTRRRGKFVITYRAACAEHAAKWMKDNEA